MNNLLKKGALILSATLLCTGFAAEAAQHRIARAFDKDVNPLRYARKVEPTAFQKAIALKSLCNNNLKATSSKGLPTSDRMGFLEAPDGSTWYFTCNYDIEEKPLPGGYATEKITTAYHFTIYDNHLNEIGSISDEVELQEGESKLADVQIDATLTRKFFNNNDNYEVMLMLVMNKTDLSTLPYVNTRTNIYTIGGTKDENGYDEPISVMPGYCIDALDFAPDSWSENFYITFMEDVGPDPDQDYPELIEYLSAHKTRLTTYKKGGYSGEPQAVNVEEIPSINLPGDQINAPFFMTLNHGGKPLFIISQYEKTFFVDPTYSTGSDEITPDNKLIVKAKELPSLYASEATELYTTEIPTVIKDDESVLATFYSVGSLSYKNDVCLNDDGALSYVITAQDYMVSDDDSYIHTFYTYDADGTEKAKIAEGVGNFVVMSDIPEKEHQAMMIYNTDNEYEFSFVDYPSGEEALRIPQVLDGMPITATIDRTKLNGEIFYVASLSNPTYDSDNNTLAQIGWINTQGSFDHIDNVNIGQDVAYSIQYIDATALNPYLFNTDNAMEYMSLVKRYTGAGTETREELIVGGSNGNILTLLPDENMGILSNITLANQNSSPQLIVSYNNDNKLTAQIYDLPLAKFAGGNGSADDPYQIATAGDLQQISSAPSAHYTIVNNLDMTGTEFSPISGFSGVLDGNGHSISNLTFKQGDYQTGLFSQTSKAEDETTGGSATVRNLTFIKPSLNLDGNTSTAGVIAGDATTLTIENVSIFGLLANTDEANGFSGTFGSLVGGCYLNSQISQCLVSAADIDLPEATVGGIAGQTRTGASITACAFSGTINGGSGVGGVAGTTASNDETISDCHVNADITGHSSVGGIVGEASRGTITRCHAEGSIMATTPDSWNGSLGAGGIAGSLSTDYSGNSTPIITNNIVNMSSISGNLPDGTPEYATQFDTVHRIVGKTSANEAEVVDYDPETYEPIYGDPGPADAGLAGNYVISPAEPTNSDIEANATSTEGSTLSTDNLEQSFFEGLGYAYGESANEPWSNLHPTSPTLYFETSIATVTDEIHAVEGETFNVDLLLLTREELTLDDIFADFLCDYNESMVEMTGNANLNGNTLSIEFNCLKEGVSTLSITLFGSTATITVTGVSGIETVEAAKAGISFDGSTVSAPGCAITIYALNGAPVATGYDHLSAESLATGFYVAVATSANGRQTLKIAVR